MEEMCHLTQAMMPFLTGEILPGDMDIELKPLREHRNACPLCKGPDSEESLAHEADSLQGFLAEFGITNPVTWVTVVDANGRSYNAATCAA